MANNVYCEDCIHDETCSAVRSILGIVTYVKGMVCCDSYEEGDHESLSDIQKPNSKKSLQN